MRRVKAEFRETEARHAARVSELIEEVAAAKGEGEAKAQEADKAADALLKRVETLEVSRQEQLETDYVSRDAVAEMGKLFRSTIDALAARLEDLEGKRVSDVAAGRSRGRVSAGARAVLESLDAGEDLPPLHERFGGRRRAKPPATQNMPRAPPRRRLPAGARRRRRPVGPGLARGARDLGGGAGFCRLVGGRDRLALAPALGARVAQGLRRGRWAPVSVG